MGEHLRIVLLEEAMDVVVLYGEHLRIVLLCRFPGSARLGA